MGNPLYNMLNNMGMNRRPNNMMNIMSQVRQLQNNPGQILDILLQNGKINQQQYQMFLPYKDRPDQIVKMLIQQGNGDQIRQAEQLADSINK